MKEFVEKLISRLEEKFKYNSEQAEIWRNGSDKDAFFREKKDLYMDRANTYGEVMRIAKQLAEEHKEKDCSQCSRRSWYQKGYKDAEKNNGWIPCSERLPEKDMWCLATFESGNVDKIQYLVTNNWGWNGMRGDNKVIAWMPLPAPFKKGE